MLRCINISPVILTFQLDLKMVGTDLINLAEAIRSMPSLLKC